MRLLISVCLFATCVFSYGADEVRVSYAPNYVHRNAILKGVTGIYLIGTSWAKFREGGYKEGKRIKIPHELSQQLAEKKTTASSARKELVVAIQGYLPTQSQGIFEEIESEFRTARQKFLSFLNTIWLKVEKAAATFSDEIGLTKINEIHTKMQTYADLVEDAYKAENDIVEFIKSIPTWRKTYVPMALDGTGGLLGLALIVDSTRDEVILYSAK